MGAHSFLADPNFELRRPKMQSNLGHSDQRLALQWIQGNIETFGGDPTQVTVMGRSAGAGSIVNHLVWEDLERTGPASDTPFKKAIIRARLGYRLQHRQTDLERRFVLQVDCLICLVRMILLRLGGSRRVTSGTLLGYWLATLLMVSDERGA